MTRPSSPILDDVRKDLAAFADAATPVELVNRGTAVLARWVQSDVVREARLLVSESDFPVVQMGGKKYNYRAFLASEHLADLKRLARTVARVGSGIGKFVETRATLETDDNDAPEKAKPATTLITELATEKLPFGATRVVFVKGAAGCGKTYLLKKIAYEQARKYERGEVDKLFFYVDAQGKSLTRFDEAISKELGDLKMPLSHHAIAPLTRRGCIVVIVDGFDELLGTGGYDEAFASLTDFLAQLQGEGSVVASARSTFYDYKGFRKTAQKYAADQGLNYVLEAIDVHPWGKPEVVQYFSLLKADRPSAIGDPSDLYERLVSSARGRNRELLAKPFYVAQIIDLVTGKAELDSNQSLLPQVVDWLAEREANKLKDHQGHPILTKEGHLRFMTDLAEEMWWQESREVDIPTIQALAELLGENLKLSPMKINIIVERAPSNAFLKRPGEANHSKVAFEGEGFYSFFLAQRLEQYLAEGGSRLREFLSRATLPDSILDEVLPLSARSGEQIEHMLKSIGDALLLRSSELVAQENAGRIIAATTAGRKDLPDHLVFRKLILRKQSLRGLRLVSPEFDSCFFEEVDLTECCWDKPILRNTVFNFPLIDPGSTRLLGTRFILNDTLVGVFANIHGRFQRVTDPSKVSQFLQSVGAFLEGYQVTEQVAYSPEVIRRIALLERLLSYAHRSFYISRSEVHLKHVFGAPEWKTLDSLLRKFGVAKEVVIDKRGSVQDLMQLQFPPDLVREGQYPSPTTPKEIVNFWHALVAG